MFIDFLHSLLFPVIYFPCSLVLSCFISLFTRLSISHSVFHFPSFISHVIYFYLVLSLYLSLLFSHSSLSFPFIYLPCNLFISSFISLCSLISQSIFHLLVTLMYRCLSDWSCLFISYAVCRSLIIFFHRCCFFAIFVSGY